MRPRCVRWLGARGGLISGISRRDIGSSRQVSRMVPAAWTGAAMARPLAAGAAVWADETMCAERIRRESPEGIRRATLSAAPHPPHIGRMKITRVPPELEGSLVYPMRTYRVVGEEWRIAEPAGLAIQVRQPRPLDPLSRRISQCGCPTARGSNYRDLGEYLGAGVSRRAPLPVRWQERPLRLRAADRSGARLRQDKQRRVHQLRLRGMGASE